MMIEQATTHDIPHLTELLRELFSNEPQFAIDTEAQERGLSAILNDPAKGEIFIAREDDIPVGMVCLLYTISTARGGKTALLEDVIVSEAYRNQGIGRKLLEHAISHAASTGCLRISLLTDVENHGAQRLYRDMGFEEYHMLPMRLHL